MQIPLFFPCILVLVGNLEMEISTLNLAYERTENTSSNLDVLDKKSHKMCTK